VKSRNLPDDGVPKKEPPFPAAFEVDNREASNRVDRSHSVSKEDAPVISQKA
jgi:hypothetical protein